MRKMDITDTREYQVWACLYGGVKCFECLGIEDLRIKLMGIEDAFWNFLKAKEEELYMKKFISKRHTTI